LVPGTSGSDLAPLWILYTSVCSAASLLDGLSKVWTPLGELFFLLEEPKRVSVANNSG
jgi:hypothetical protein